MRQPKHIYDPIFRMNYYVCYGWPVKSVTAAMKEVANYDLEGVTWRGFMIALDTYNTWIWTVDKAVCSLVHEAQHAAYQTLTNRGVVHTEESDEVFSYYVDMIVRLTLNEDVPPLGKGS